MEKDLIVTIVASISALIATLITCTWIVSNRFAKIEAVLEGVLAVLRAHDKRIERLEDAEDERNG